MGIFDADVYGPSLPLMVTPEKPILEMVPETKVGGRRPGREGARGAQDGRLGAARNTHAPSHPQAILPTEYEGVKVVSFGFAGQGSAIMRGPMVSGLIQQMLTTAEWGELDYLVVDFPPGAPRANVFRQRG